MSTSKSNNSPWPVLFFCFLCIMAVFFYALWSRYSSPIIYYSARFYWSVISIIDFNIPIYRDWVENIKEELIQIATYSKQAPFSVYFDVMNKIGKIFIPIPVIFSAYLIYKINKHPKNKLKRIITIENLPSIMAEFSTPIIPCLYYGDKKTLLLHDDPEEHKSALTPDEFVEKHNLLEDRYNFNRDKCKDILIEQLGVKINNIDDLSQVEKAIFTIFAFRNFGDYELNESINLCDKLNISCHKGTFNNKKGYPIFSAVDPLFEKFKKEHNNEIIQLINRYKYSRVILYAMHIAALKKGKLASSYFRWLKGMDRGLFYSLNMTGRKTPWVESAAVFIQYLWVEYNHQFKIVTGDIVMVEEAIDSIENYLIETGLFEKI